MTTTIIEKDGKTLFRAVSDCGGCDFACEIDPEEAKRPESMALLERMAAAALSRQRAK